MCLNRCYKICWNKSCALMNQLIKSMLAIGPWFSPHYGPCAVSNTFTAACHVSNREKINSQKDKDAGNQSAPYNSAISVILHLLCTWDEFQVKRHFCSPFMRPQVKAALLLTFPAMNTCRGMAAKFHTLCRAVLDEDEWSASHSGSFIFRDITLVTRFWKMVAKGRILPPSRIKLCYSFP